MQKLHQTQNFGTIAKDEDLNMIFLIELANFLDIKLLKL